MTAIYDANVHKELCSNLLNFNVMGKILIRDDTIQIRTRWNESYVQYTNIGGFTLVHLLYLIHRQYNHFDLFASAPNSQIIDSKAIDWLTVEFIDDGHVLERITYDNETHNVTISVGT